MLGKVKYKKMAIPSSTRVAVAERYGCPPGTSIEALCARCGSNGTIHRTRAYNGSPLRWTTFTALEMDHVIPEFLGGSSDPSNIQLLCRRCNRSKGHK